MCERCRCFEKNVLYVLRDCLRAKRFGLLLIAINFISAMSKVGLQVISFLIVTRNSHGISCFRLLFGIFGKVGMMRFLMNFVIPLKLCFKVINLLMIFFDL